MRDLLPTGTRVWAASGVGPDPPRLRGGADRTLFDTLDHGLCGGTGKSFDWGKLDRRMVKNSILAGGLNPSNARRAARVGAWALDVGSGVEAKRGIKDQAKLTAFFDALRPTSTRELSR